MKTKLLLCLAFGFSVLKSAAQSSLVWSKPFSTSGYTYFFNDNNGNLYSVFTVIKMGAPNNQAYKLMKSNENGDTLWSVITECIVATHAVDIQGNVYLAGSQKAGLASKAQVLKVDASGNVVWDKLFFDAEFSTDRIEMMRPDPDGNGVYVIAYDYALNGWNATSKSHILSYGKIDGNGNLAWSHTYAGPTGTNLRVSRDNQYIETDNEKNLRVVCSVDLSSISSIESTGIYCVKVSSTGTKLWESITGTREAPRKVRSSLLDKDGNILLTTDTFRGFYNAVRISKVSGMDGSLISEVLYETMEAGNPGSLFRMQDKIYLITTKADEKYMINELNDQDSLVAGEEFKSPVADSKISGYDRVEVKEGVAFIKFFLYNGSSTFKTNYLVKVNSDLKKTWSLIYKYEGSITRGIVRAKDSVFIFIAKDSSLNGFAMIEKHNTTINNEEPATGLFHATRNTLNASIYPNPAREYLNIYAPGVYTASLYSISGMKIAETKGTRLRLENIVPGIYFLRIEGEKGTYQQKIVVE